MALFVLAVVGVIVAQTWLDWRDTKKHIAVPDWARGTALAGVVAITLTAATSFASSWLQSASGEWNAVLGSRFWLESAFLVCTMGIIIFAVRKKRLRLVFLLAAGAVVAFWLGVSLSL